MTGPDVANEDADPGWSTYASFLPPQRQGAVVEPERSWWGWRGHEVQLLRRPNADAAVRMLVVHGAGAHAEALWPVATQVDGLDLTAVDLPLYGRTRTRRRSRVRYQDWIDLLVDLVEAELRADADGRPLILLGGSIGGLLAVEAAARSGRVAQVVATCLLDPQDPQARARMTRFGRPGGVSMRLLPMVRGPLARLPVRISWVAPLSRMGRDPGLGSLCAGDPRGGAARVPLGFMASYLSHEHAAARRIPVPVLLTHPEQDDWTPIGLSRRTLAQVPGPTEEVVLGGCGHFPLEEPGLQQLVERLAALVDEVAGGQREKD
ncbi:alpha/beta fold hydrolase [Ornithinimicrobium sp. Y1847]|uniref:alpha/beta fold hydrolase n=1 Tax=unclassified Ornithinimicrobium TaxID=2615080 RepID=UPI003B672505